MSRTTGRVRWTSLLSNDGMRAASSPRLERQKGPEKLSDKWRDSNRRGGHRQNQPFRHEEERPPETRIGGKPLGERQSLVCPLRRPVHRVPPVTTGQQVADQRGEAARSQYKSRFINNMYRSSGSVSYTHLRA